MKLCSVFILQFNHNIAFVTLSNNILALMNYITNYETNDACSQYSKIMEVVFVKKVYDDMQPSASIITHVAFDKFAFKAFNNLLYDWKISSLLVVSYLLKMPNYYTLSDNIKSINLTILWKCFSEFILYIYKHKSNANNFIKL